MKESPQLKNESSRKNCVFKQAVWRKSLGRETVLKAKICTFGKNTYFHWWSSFLFHSVVEDQLWSYDAQSIRRLGLCRTNFTRTKSEPESHSVSVLPHYDTATNSKSKIFDLNFGIYNGNLNSLYALASKATGAIYSYMLSQSSINKKQRYHPANSGSFYILLIYIVFQHAHLLMGGFVFRTSFQKN